MTQSEQPRPWPERIRDMLGAVAAIRESTEGMTFDDFRSNVVVRSAVLYHLIVLGEASIGLPPEVQARPSLIPWRAIRGTRNTLVHAYYRTDLVTVWSIVTNDLDPLVVPLRVLLGSSSEP